MFIVVMCRQTLCDTVAQWSGLSTTIALNTVYSWGTGQIKILPEGGTSRIVIGITKVRSIHPDGNMNICTNFNANSSNSCQEKSPPKIQKPEPYGDASEKKIKKQRISKIRGVHPLGTVNVYTEFCAIHQVDVEIFQRLYENLFLLCCFRNVRGWPKTERSILWGPGMSVHNFHDNSSTKYWTISLKNNKQ